MERSVAWQPITPRGVAEFARAPFTRLLVYQLLFALILAASVAWFLYAAVWPSVETAIRRLPNEGEIRSGTLQWKNESPVLLSEARVISVAVDLVHSGQIRVPSDIFVEFGSKSWRVFSFAGFLEFPYLRGYVVGFNKSTLMPWWGAWRAPILVLAILASLLGVLSLWCLLATLYCPVALLIAFYANRRATLSEAWRLCAAAAMPASAALWVGLLLYGMAAISLLPFLLLVVLHIVLVWVYAGISVACLPPDSAVPVGKNPFKKPE